MPTSHPQNGQRLNDIFIFSKLKEGPKNEHAPRRLQGRQMKKFSPNLAGEFHIFSSFIERQSPSAGFAGARRPLNWWSGGEHRPLADMRRPSSGAAHLWLPRCTDCA